MFTDNIDMEEELFRNNNGYESLSIAIVLQAIKDYKAAYRIGNKKNCEIIERFLTNSWISDFFINISFDSILHKIRNNIDENKKNGTRMYLKPTNRNYTARWKSTN